MLIDTILHAKGNQVHTLPDSATLADAVALLNANNIGAIVVTTQAGAIAGILSERDIVRRLGSEVTTILAMPVSQAMTRAVITCTTATPIDDVMETMTQRRIRHMPVTDEERLIGIISIGDVVKYKIEQAEREAAQLRDYIAS